MAKKKAAKKMARKAAKKKAANARPARSRGLAFHPDAGTAPLDAALYVTFAGELAGRSVEYCHAPVTQAIQGFVVQINEISARPSDCVFDAEGCRDATRDTFEASDYREMPFKRVVGRVLDELLNYRRHNGKSYKTCSGGDVYFLLLDELPEQLPAAHQQILSGPKAKFNRTLNPGRRIIDNRLADLKGGTREDGRPIGAAWAETVSTTQGGAEQGYRLTELGQWLFDGWPELPDLFRKRS
jgi:hypothetical protein